MGSVQRAFAQKLTKQHASDVRRQIAATSYSRDIGKAIGNVSVVSTTVSAGDVVDPLDYEDFIQQHQMLIDRDPLRQMLDFPPNDIEVGVIPRKIRTEAPVLPEEPLSELSPQVRDCVESYTRDWIVVDYRFRHHSSSAFSQNRSEERLTTLQNIPPQEFEVDGDPSVPSVTVPLDAQSISSGRQSLTSSDTPRGSWASFDLQNSVSDPVIPGLLERVAPETIDKLNETRRQEDRQACLFSLYPQQDEEDMIERRISADIPSEHMGHRILVKCLQLKLELEVEPIFASIALYDCKEKKKISESFYFDMNTEGLKRMLTSHIPYSDSSTLSRSCIFDITYPSTDLFLVIKLEKVLQGDISECAEPYMKDDKNREKVKANAVAACERLGKYRMPFAWTAIYVMNILNGVNSLERDSGSDKESSASNSLDRKFSNTSLEQLKKRASDMGTLTRRGSLERRSGSEKRRSWSPEDFGSSLDTFRPVTLTVSSFFKQEQDRLRDEDLYKFLVDLKRPCSVLKKKCIPGTLKLDISPCPDDLPYSLTPELARINPYPDEKGRPTKEVLEFPPREMFIPHYLYRNLLFVSPKDLNFAGRTGSARNIAVKMQLMCGEEEHNAMPVIFGKSSCPEFATEAYTTVSYHSKCPDFYDEFKVKLPANLGDQHHILFTFYHISCQRKEEKTTVETPVGYTWLPVFRDGRLQTGEFCLPVMMERPPPNYSYIPPDVLLPGTKWVDNHKGIFVVVLDAVSSVHTQDKYLDKFLSLCAALEGGNIPPRIGEANMEATLKSSILDLTHAKSEPLVKFLPIVLDKLIFLLVRPPAIGGQLMNIGQTTFEALASMVKSVTALPEGLGQGPQHEQHAGAGRHSLLTAYITYQCALPHPIDPVHGDPCGSLPLALGELGLSAPQSPAQGSGRPVRSTSNPNLHGLLQQEELATAGSLAGRGLDRTASMRAPGPGPCPCPAPGAPPGSGCEPLYAHPGAGKVVHEELALQWVVSSGQARELAMANAWFLLELMVKSMVEHLAATDALDGHRKGRLSEQFTDDVTTLVCTLTSDIISRYSKDPKLAQSMNSSLAFFLFDLLSVMDRGYVLALIKTYYKQMSAKISSLPDAVGLISLKLEFLRIICSHEHFVPLNLPFGTPMTPSSAPSSPNPSITSSNSQSSFISTLVGGDKMSFSELSPEFRQQHFLVGLVLGDLAAVLTLQNASLHAKAVNMVRNLLTSHDSDPRYEDPDCRARVAALYLPLLTIVMDNLSQLHGRSPLYPGGGAGGAGGAGVGAGLDDALDAQPGINQSVAMAIAGTSMYGTKTSSADAHAHGFDAHPHPHAYPHSQPRKTSLTADTTRHLLAGFLWVLKNMNKSVLKQWWAELPPQRIHQLLETMFVCSFTFEYHGKRGLGTGPDLLKRCAPQTITKTTDAKSKLEDMILGQSSARNEMMLRHKAALGAAGGAAAAGERLRELRWRKEQMAYRPLGSLGADLGDKHAGDLEADAQFEGNLATEVSLVILDALEQMVAVASRSDALQPLLGPMLKVLLHALARNQSSSVLKHMFATQRALVFKFPNLLFDEETEQCADLCLQLLRHCSSSRAAVRSQASASLYLLMRQNFEQNLGNNFARVKMQVTMSLSSLVGTSRTFSEESLRRSLKTILVYAVEDAELQETTFPEQVKDLVFNLHMILSDTVKMKEFQEDPEMLLDLMFRIAKGYQNSPDLRLTWLANMAQKHMERNNHTEAGMCLVHSAALVAEYLHMLEERPHLPLGAVALERVTPNALEESAVSDDVVSPEEEGICLGKDFTESGLVALLEHAAGSFNLAGMYEAVNDVYSILIPMAEANRDYKRLAAIHAKLHEAFSRVEQLQGKRVFGTYFRVGFYGSKLGDLNGEEFVYKEPTLTKLPEIFSRLENFYAERYGAENVQIIKDSNAVDQSTLDPDKAYIQITYVEPYFEPFELRHRQTYFDRNFNVKRFVFATPFTPAGRAHGELHEQYKRKTILTTANHFPYVKTRIQVVGRKQVELTPIEVAIEDIQKKTAELAQSIHQEPPDPKILQMVLQGCIGTTVNQGPMEIALVFLSDLVDGQRTPSKFQNKLRLCFKDFSKKCSDALRKNKNLIGPDQRDYQRELERNYHRFTDRLMPLITLNNIAGRTLK